MHLLIPFASSLSPECQQTLATLKLPNLDKLLRRLPLAHTDVADETTLSPPHERALAAAYGISVPNSATTAWPDGQTPWGAWHAAQAGYVAKQAGNRPAQAGHAPTQPGHAAAPGDAWAVITPCHWTVQTSHITMTHPRALNLADDESRALLAAMQPYFAEDGIALMYDTPTRWLARGEVFAGLATASPYRVVGGKVDDWLPKAAAAKNLRRLQQEMQMLLYTHPLSDARAARGLPAVNSFWVSGTGALPPGSAHPANARASASPARAEFGKPTQYNLQGTAQLSTQMATQNATSITVPVIVPILVPNTLRDAVIRSDWPAWAQAWQQIDSTECAALLQAIAMKSNATLTLCGERSAQTYQARHNGLKNRVLQTIRGYFGPQPASHILSKL